MAKILVDKRNHVERFFNKYGKKPQNFVIKADKVENIKNLTPQQLKERTKIEEAIKEAYDALATSNKILLGI